MTENEVPTTEERLKHYLQQFYRGFAGFEIEYLRDFTTQERKVFY